MLGSSQMGDSGREVQWGLLGHSSGSRAGGSVGLYQTMAAEGEIREAYQKA